MLERMYLLINYLRFLPHILLFCITKNKEIIREDIIAYRNEYQLKGNDIHVFIQLMSHNLSFRSLFYYRIGKIRWMIQWLGKGINNLTLPPTTEIEGGVLFFHSYGTILNGKFIGKGCRIVHNVTLGDKKGGVPTIGRNVELLPNAVIVGDISVGNNCVIGPGAVVFKSVPDNCVVVCNPAYILKKDGVVVNQKL